MVSDPVEDTSINFNVITLHVDGGGLVEGSYVYIHAENITVDAGGVFRGDGLGYRVTDGVSTYPNGTFRWGRHGVINFGLGFTGSGGSSGAGHGGSGGHGQGAAKTGLPYSDLYEPEEFGSAGGGTTGGSGGGRIWFNVTDTIHIDGVVSSDGNPGGVGSGGGSGGSIWMHCNLIKGYGTISTNGGAAGSNSGGGAGGRIALNFWKNETSNGFKFESHGGLPDGDWEGGGPGTVFMYHHEHEHRTLYVENAYIYPKQKTIDWNNIEEDGCRAWILPVSGTHRHAASNNEFHFEEIQIYDGAHVAVMPPGEAMVVVESLVLNDNMDFTFLWSNSTEMEATIFFKHMIGDRTGAIHIADKQEMDLERPEIDLPFSTYVYHDGHLGLAPKTVVHGVEIFNAGLLSHIVNLTLHHGGFLWTQHGGRTEGQPPHHYAFQTVRIQDGSTINSTTDPIDEPGITFITESIYIEGGGILHGTKLTMISENITIDAGGSLTAEGLGYTGHHSNDTHGEDSLHGEVNLGKPHPVYGLGGGGGHGGSGGRGPNGKAGFAYGDLYEPFLFGSAGGHGLNNQHGGTGGGYIWLNISDTIHIDGELTANGGYADAVGSGGGSAGSVWLHCDTIKGYGRIAVNGGDGYEDNQSPGAGGAGGRLAMYFYKNETANGFNYHARGGRAGGPLAENGGAGTVFLYHMEYDHRTLLIDNGGLEAWTDHHTLYDYSDWADDGCRTWILSLSGHHYFAGGNHDFHFEELQIDGSAHVAVLTEPIGRNATLFFLYMIGDRTGTVHISENQSLDLHRPEIDLPFSARVYADGYLGLAPDTYVHGVSIWLHGTIAHVKNMTLHHYGMFTMEHGGRSLGDEESSYHFDNILVQDDGTVLGVTSTTKDPGISLYVDTLTIEGGGTVHGTRLFIQTENITIDDGGSLNVNGQGYNRTDIRDDAVGVNIGQGVASTMGSSGGGFGGTSGRGKGTPLTGQPYGNLYEPFDFGSSGGGTMGGAGGGILLLNVTGFAIIDGVVSANGVMGGDPISGSGSGGTILMTTNVLRGQGVIASNGGDQSQDYQGGAGSGGRIAVYFEVNETYRGEFHCHGGEAFNQGESGGPGTVFLYHLIHEHRTLLVDNAHLTSSYVGPIATYSDLSRDSFKAWILPQSGEHHFAGGNHNYHFEELQILGNAHLGYRTEPYDMGASFFFKHMIGDWTGNVHVGPNQVMDLERHFINVPFNIYIYQRGYTGLGYLTVLSEVFVHVEGELDHVNDLILYNGGEIRAFLTGSASSPKKRIIP
ncbi:hypothetical protein BSL78_01924 [Apostichopus japonicus]|uniref:Tenascin-X n=1 Tax=Stichopus japonicus TaxID=307972 RepID=A0A2G8LLH3_STIJA|nr:hypothetical protein BSL78_01924 [Apostichopus japonicus]